MIDVEVQDPAWTEALPGAGGVCVRAAEAALTGAKARGDVAILLADDAAVRSLNHRFRGKDRATNVLSFPAPETARPHLGDVALAFGVCGGEAAAQGKPLGDHLMHLVAHGVLHLLGYDHEIAAQAETMESLERLILAGLGAPDPYAAQDAQPDHAH